MAEHGFTPGPWAADKADMFGDHNVVRGNSDDLSAIAAVVSNMRPANEVFANARLIAASPTLLEALIQAAEEIEDLRKYANNHGGMIDNERCDYARAAITLATGKDA